MADVVDVEHSGSSGSSESSSNRLTTQNSNGRAASPSALTRTGSASSSSHNADPFRAYGYFAEYQRRKEIRLKIMQREEREQRKHKALPMPNFKAIHLRAASKEPTVPYHSSPVTPDVLKRGLAMMDKARRKREEHHRQLTKRPPFVARSANVLKEEPFKPKLDVHVITKPEPFNLNVNYLNVRQERENALRKEKEEKQKQLIEERAVQLQRQQTIFKSKPNPFEFL